MSLSPERIISFNSDIIDLTNLLRLRLDIVNAINEMRFKNYSSSDFDMIQEQFFKTLAKVDSVIKSIKE